MTYSKYAEKFLGITENEFDEVLEMFDYIDLKIYDSMCIDSTKEDLIKAIIYDSIDPQGDYIDDIDIVDGTFYIHERLDVENVNELREELEELLKHETIIYE